MAALQAKRAAQPAGNGDAPGKRARTEPASFEELLEECGCRLSAQGAAYEYVTEDPRKLRRALEQRLTLAEGQRRAFLDAVRSHLDPPEALHAALKPMTVAGPAALFTGDSFVRALLNIPPLQKDLSEYLLHRVPEFSDGDGGGAAAATTAQLILGQFRWLDCLADPHAVTALLLEVLPVMPGEARRDAVTFLPEIAPEEDHPAVLAALEAVVADAPEFLIPALEAAASMALSDEEQAGVAGMAAARLQSVEVGDLPAAVRHLLQAAGGATDTLTPVREALHFVDPADPRLAVPDRKGKWRAPAAGEDPESRTLAAMRQALQFGPGAADAVLKALKGVTEPAQHRAFDFWALLAAAAAGPDRRRAVLGLLRKKLADGHAEPAWLVRSVSGHAVALGEQFPALVGAAQALLGDGSPGAAAAGAALFEALFVEFSEAYHRQEVLRALHSHLGAPAAGEATAALGALRRLALSRTADLLQYAAFLTNILDYVTRYSADQLTAAFDVFAELVAGACRGGGGGGGASQGGGRSRMEDELFIFLRKQLSGAFPSHRRVGAVGVVALVRRLGSALEGEAGGGGAAAAGASLLAQRYREANALLESTFNAAASCPDTLAFLCDALAAEARRGALPPPLMRALAEKLGAALEGQFIVDGPQWAAAPGRDAWWNLAGREFDHVVALLPAPAGGPPGGPSREPSAAAIPTLFPMMRAVSVLNAALYGNLQAVDGLLGAPLGLFDPGDAAPSRYAALGVEAQRQVLLGLFYALNWCRELVNAFAEEAAGRGEGGGGGDASAGAHDDRMRAQMQMSLMLRVRAAAQLEAALAALLPGAPPLTTLPSLGAAPPAAAAGAPAKKPAAKKGGKSGAAGEGPSAAAAGGDGDVSAGPAALAAALAATNAGLMLPPAERAKLRPLAPSSLAALAAAAAVQGPSGLCLSSLPAAAYLLDDAVQKARLSLAPPKKAPFLAARGAGASAAAVPPAELLAALCPVLPAVRAHLDAAGRAAESRRSDADVTAEEESVLAAACVGTAPPRLLGSLPGCPAARRAASPSASAARVFASGLECVRLLLAHPDAASPERLPALQATLAAFVPRAADDAAGAWAPKQFVRGTAGAFQYFLGLAPSPEEGGSEGEEPSAAEMERWPAVLAVLEALVRVGERLAAAGGDPGLAVSWAKRLAVMREKVSGSAYFMLAHRWPAAEADDDGGGEPPAGGWKGRATALSEAVRLSIVYDKNPLAMLENYVSHGLLLVAPAPTGKGNAAPLDEIPSLSGATLGVWYRVMWDVLQARWREVAAAARSSARAAGGAEPEAAAAIAQGARACCCAFSHLVSVVKHHDRRAVVLNAAAKGGAAFIAGVLRAMPFWREVFASHREEVIDSVKAVQRACRILNHLCAEGKVRGDMNVVSRVSRLKKAIEAFVNDSYLLLRGAAPELVRQFGELKHRDLQGNVLATSQMFPGAEGEEEEEAGDEGEEEEEEEEEEGDEEEREY